MKYDNPRYPHYCVITRQPQTDPMQDEVPENDPMADEEQIPDTQDSQEEEEEQEVTTSGETSQEESSEEEESVTVIYEGECRAYDKNTTSDKGEVITSYRGLALPVTKDGWIEKGVVPQEGDKVVVNRGGYEEYGTVIDKKPANFGGTHLIWKYGRV